MTGYYLCLLVMTLLGSVASIFLKKASGSPGIGAILQNVNLYIGGLLYLAGALLNILLLRYLDYSVVLPLTALTYIWTMLFSRLLLQEKISARKITGVFLILAGAFAISL